MPKKLQEEILTEYAERIVIEYANLSGREIVNRAEFREKIRQILRSALERQHRADMDEVKKVIEEAITTYGCSEKLCSYCKMVKQDILPKLNTIKNK